MSLILEMDVNALAAAVDEIDGFVHAFNDGKVLQGVNQIAFNKFKHSFADSVDDAAKASAATDPKGRGIFNHMYEAGQPGVETARLFNVIIPKEVRMTTRSEIYARIDYKNATSPEFIWGIYRTRNANAIWPVRPTTVFTEKARVLEEGESVTIPGATKSITFYSEASGRARLVNLTRDVVVDTSSFSTYHALTDHFYSFIYGGLMNSVLKDTADETQAKAIRQVIKHLEAKIARYNATYQQYKTVGGERRGINRRNRNHISREYVRFLEKTLKGLGEST